WFQYCVVFHSEFVVFVLVNKLVGIFICGHNFFRLRKFAIHVFLRSRFIKTQVFVNKYFLGCFGSFLLLLCNWGISICRFFCNFIHRFIGGRLVLFSKLSFLRIWIHFRLLSFNIYLIRVLSYWYNWVIIASRFWYVYNTTFIFIRIHFFDYQ
uniref:Uncharacterized protein n=1 Tax=Ciona savignyi TaxID=51511 RepID=H2YQD0_CIOSA